MKRVSITEARRSLRALIDSLKAGSSLLITDRGHPVARLEPVIMGADTTDNERLARLVRKGIVRPRRKASFPKELLTEPPPRAKGGVSIVDILIEERRKGR
jgi:antitoxin (DNA-binding transcriptional repressor) of toxin-antitoxin stability system